MSLAGRLEDLSLSDIFQILSIGRKTGTFLVSGRDRTAIIVFKDGLIVRAETDDLEGNIGHDIVNAGLVKDTVFHMAVEVKKRLPTKSLADILYDFGSVSKGVLEKITKKRIEKVIYRLLLWQDGDFRFELDNLAIEDMTNLSDLGWETSKGLSPEYLLMEGARVYDESSQSSIVSNEEFFIEESAEETGWGEEWTEQPSERKDISALKSLTQELRFPNSASEITLLILRFASDMFQRGVLFMVGKNEMVGLGQFGLDIDRPDEKVRETILNLNNSAFFKKIILEQMPYKGALEKDEISKKLIYELSGVWPANVAIFPLIAEGKVVGILYCDNLATTDSIVETEGLEIFINHAGLALEKSLLQRRLQEIEKKQGSN